MALPSPNWIRLTKSGAPAHWQITADQTGNPVVGGMGIFRRARNIEFGAQIYGVLKPMSTDAKVEKYEALRLGYLPIVALTIRHTIPPGCQMSQSLTLELLRGEKTVSLKFTGLRQLRLANLGPGSSCLMNISSVAQDQWEGVRYRVFNGEQDLTLSFYCVDFEFSS